MGNRQRIFIIGSVAAIVVLAILVAAYNQLGVYHPNISSATTERNLLVVTSVDPIANMIKNVGGDKVDILKIVPDNSDSHTFKLSVTDDIIIRTRADLVIINGLNLETTIEDSAGHSDNPKLRILKLADRTIDREQWVFDNSFPERDGNPNPHLWLDVQYAINYVKLIHDELSMADPNNAQYFDSNAERYLQRLEKLDLSILEAVQTIPQENRKLVTYHDSLPYFANRYGFEVIAAFQPASFGEPTSDEISRIVAQIKAEKVHAIFASEVFPNVITEQIASQTGVEVVRTLRDDVLPGDLGASQHTYVGLMVTDVRTMVAALGGDASVLEEIDPRNTYDINSLA